MQVSPFEFPVGQEFDFFENLEIIDFNSSNTQQYVKKISWVYDKTKQRFMKRTFSKYQKIFQLQQFDLFQKVMEWIFSNLQESINLQWFDEKSLSELSYEYKQINQTEFSKSKFEKEFRIIFIILQKLIENITVQIQEYFKNLKDEDLITMFEGKELSDFEIKQIICKNESIHFIFTKIFLKNIFIESNKFNMQQAIQLNQQENFQKYLKIGKDDVVASKVNMDIFGLIMWVGPFTDQILDIIYLITGAFYMPVFFYLYLFSFLLSLLGVIFNVFYEAHKYIQKKQTSFPYIKTSFISICTWLRIDELIYLLGYRKYIRDHFQPDIQVGFQNYQCYYSDPNEISKQQRKHQKIELYSENILQFIVLVTNQTLLRDWDVFNLFQSSLSLTLMIIQIFKFYVKDNDLQIDKLMDLMNYALIKFGHVNKSIGLIYAITVLCINLEALNQLDLLDDSSDLAQFQTKFRSQIIFAIVAIVIDVIHFVIFIFIFESGDDNKDFDNLNKNKCSTNEIIETIQALYIFFVDYLLYAILQVTYSYFEIKMYNIFYVQLTTEDKNKFEIMRFRFSYFMLIIFISTYVLHPLAYVPLALHLFFFMILIGFFSFINLVLYCFGVKSSKLNKIVERLKELFAKPLE